MPAFEVYPVMGNVGAHHALGEDPEKATPLEGPVEWRWRFRTADDKVTAQSARGYDSSHEARRQVALFVGQVRQATYGQRYEDEIIDAVIVMDE